MHVRIHGAHGNALPWVRDGTVRTIRVVGRADGIRVGIIDGITARSIEVDEGVERRVPSAVGPDVVEDAVIVDPVAAADRHLPVAHHIPREADAGRKIVISRLPHPGNWTHPQIVKASAVREATSAEIRELSHDPVIFRRGTITVPANSEVESDPRAELPVVLQKRIVVVVSVVAVGIRFGTRCRINRSLLIVGIIICEIGMRFLAGTDAGNRAIRL